VLATVDLPAYLPIGLLIVMAITFAIANLLISQVLGQRREGAVKGIAYESGMNPITTARKRFNVRFYILAMIFLVFDVEIIFLYPWASTFAQMEPGGEQSWLFFGRILFFLLTTVVAYLYAARKGVFRFN
jgi:NADH-quinone oxidoreductase subunit A